MEEGIMRKFITGVLIFALCLSFIMLCSGFLTEVYAIDEDSLESRTTEGLYDRTDPFDLAQQPGLLFEINRWRLYTNLSSYSGDDDLGSDSFLIGTSGKLGPGSLAVFFETDRYELINEDSITFNEREDRDWSGGDPNNYPNYDGVYDDDQEDETITTKSEEEVENKNFLIGYGMDFNAFSLGISYAPEFRDEKQTISLRDPEQWWVYIIEENFILDDFMDNFTDDPPQSARQNALNYFRTNLFANLDIVHNAFNKIDDFEEFDEEYDNWDLSYTETDYTNEDHTDSFSATNRQSFNAVRNLDTEEHPINLQSKIHMADSWDLLVGASFGSIERNDDFSGAYTETTQASESFTGYDLDESITVSFNGNGNRDILDGDALGIMLEPTYKLNDIVKLRMNLDYMTADGDTKGEGILATVSMTRREKLGGVNFTQEWTVNETWDSLSTGDFDFDSMNIEPRVYLTYDKVRFAFGMGYRSENYEESRSTLIAKEGTYKYVDGDPAVDNDWEVKGSFSESWNINIDREETEWIFPVATEFDVTDKLTFRAGAAYSRNTVEETAKTVITDPHDEEWTVIDGQNIESVGPDASFEDPNDSIPDPYDDSYENETITRKTDETFDSTTYQLGLGYKFSDRLNVDLMWTKNQAAGVDLSDVYASMTFAF